LSLNNLRLLIVIDSLHLSHCSPIYWSITLLHYFITPLHLCIAHPWCCSVCGNRVLASLFFLWYLHSYLISCITHSVMISNCITYCYISSHTQVSIGYLENLQMPLLQMQKIHLATL
jgi:hypothetical protein